MPLFSQVNSICEEDRRLPSEYLLRHNWNHPKRVGKRGKKHQNQSYIGGFLPDHEILSLYILTPRSGNPFSF